MYDIVDGVPHLLLSKSRTAYKNQQASSHDKSDALGEQTFETVRPVHAPAFYGWLMTQKHDRGTIGLSTIDSGATVLVSCGGSGMDAHFLATRGAQVISLDISQGSAARTALRAAQFDLPILSIVGDAERLPLANSAVDVAYVHDGLHHLEHPLAAIDEMARVASQALSVTEPARAAATSVAVSVGAAESIEESGNTVRRFTLNEIVGQFAQNGFESIEPHRYAMWYRHTPGWLVRFLSRPRVRPLAEALFLSANRLMGPYGNKLAVQGRRAAAS